MSIATRATRSVLPVRGSAFAATLHPVAMAMAIAMAIATTACSERPSFMPGGECELNTQCATPLVCRLGRCRVECRAQRDCPTTLECVRDELGLGACQLPEETECTLSSECPQFLLCHFGRCANACEADRDCPSGSHCVNEEGGARGCRDESMIECALTSDCPAGSGLICAVDRRCRPPCRTDWDCSDGRACVSDGRDLVCRDRQRDGGLDASTREAGVDGGPLDGGPLDGGPLDGGPLDGGTDASAMDDGGMDASPPDAGAMDSAVVLDAGVDAGTDAMADGGAMAIAPPPAPRLAGSIRNTCAAPGGALRCWGDNDTGQIGDGTTTPRPEPTAVLGVVDPSVIGLGHGHGCAPTSSGLVCWGKNDRGQLGIGVASPVSMSTPVMVDGLPGGATIEDLALGTAHTCAIASGELYCWGANDVGQLGVGDRTDRTRPVRVLGLSDIPVQVDTFSVHTCVLTADGGVECFGANSAGQLGTGDRVEALSPARLAGITEAVDLAVGSAHTCVIRGSAGAMLCWGSDTVGQVGDGGMVGDPTPDVLTPTPTASLGEPALQMAAGSSHTCARTASAMYCWGDNLFSQCGRDRTMTATLYVPSAVAGLGVLDEVTAGSRHTCARQTDGTHLCFGSNASGQLGLGAGSPITQTHTPMEVVWP